MHRKRPFVTANFAITADGRISTRAHTPADFSSPVDKHRLLEIRATCDAVLAGMETITKDRMTMGLPDKALSEERVQKGMPPYPVRVLMTSRGKVDLTMPLFGKAYGPIVICSTTRMPQDIREALESKATVRLWKDRVDLPEMMQMLRKEFAVKRLVCEGGARVFRALLEANLVDEIHLTMTPRVFGGRKAPTLTGVAGEYLPQSSRFRLAEFRPVGSECFLRYRALD